ncbi:patatin-like phospholipase family protein [Alkalicoccobacillus plakortidis]|uniref:Patatin-like phospholipase family protein n=1 Tax=Alkalicoccobacillus plakortidis TaxID=444060 RepID=A0ABT0XGF6_9BACI|nr:patatin-like phospholipase family protein [Alkalicoccobacillus plakortidis]MCM2674991.1 patatin-like phospholipase family protein [Alkalicoccobacillus plakortidis]
MKIDAVFAGGGVKAFAFLGSLRVLEKRGYEFERVAGTSAGSIVAALVKAGYTSEEMMNILDQINIESFKDDRMSFLPLTVIKWLHVYFKLGLYRGDALESWIRDLLKEKGIVTFGDLPDKALRVVVSDLSKGQMIVLPDDLEKYGIRAESFSVAKAIRMSCSIPYFFEPVKLYDRAGHYSYIVDGGLLSNFPIWLFRDGEKNSWRRPVIGLQLKPKIEDQPPHKIKNAIDLYKAVFDTMTTAHDTRHIEDEDAENVIFIPVTDIKATDFDLTPLEKQDLITLGETKTNKFLGRWTY